MRELFCEDPLEDVVGAITDDLLNLGDGGYMRVYNDYDDPNCYAEM